MMPIQSRETLVTSIKKMNQYCRDIQDLINTDKNHFSTNSVGHLNASNVNKIELIEKLTDLIKETHGNALPENQTDNLFETIQKSAESLGDAAKHEINTLLAELKSVIVNAYQGITINSQVISASTQQLKNVWDKIRDCQSEIEYVYDNKGNAAK